MGWQRDDPDHEGFVVGVYPTGDGQWREFGPGDVAQPVWFVQAACTCGWRSCRLAAPVGSEFVPSMVEFLSDARRDLVGDIWGRHMDAPGSSFDLLVALPERATS